MDLDMELIILLAAIGALIFVIVVSIVCWCQFIRSKRKNYQVRRQQQELELRGMLLTEPQEEQSTEKLVGPPEKPPRVKFEKQQELPKKQCQRQFKQSKSARAKRLELQRQQQRREQFLKDLREHLLEPRIDLRKKQEPKEKEDEVLKEKVEE